jgi:hypothetical protein
MRGDGAVSLVESSLVDKPSFAVRGVNLEIRGAAADLDLSLVRICAKAEGFRVSSFLGGLSFVVVVLFGFVLLPTALNELMDGSLGSA